MYLFNKHCGCCVVDRAQKQREQQILLQQQQQQQMHQNRQSTSIGSRIRRTTSAFAPRLFGGPNSEQSDNNSNNSMNNPNNSNAYGQRSQANSNATPHSILPPPPQMLSSKSTGHLPNVENVPLPAPTPGGPSSNSAMNNSNIRISGGGSGRRVAPTVKYDLQKTSQNETVIQASELLEHVFYRINDLIDHRQDELDVQEGANYDDVVTTKNKNKNKNKDENNGNDKNESENENDNNNNNNEDGYTDLNGLSKKNALKKKNEELNLKQNKNDENIGGIGSNDAEMKESLSILKTDQESLNKVKKRFIAILIEYTRTMHRMRLKLPISISMLLIKLLRKSNQLYTLHQLFQVR